MLERIFLILREVLCHLPTSSNNVPTSNMLQVWMGLPTASNIQHAARYYNCRHKTDLQPHVALGIRQNIFEKC
jgi:hypothetical protein